MLSASFDLHVLGTPPAFILSQDQTLMLKFFLSRSSLAFLVFTRIYCFKVLLSFNRSVRLSDISIRQPEISSDPVLLDPLNLSRSVHCSVINVLFCCPPFSATACLLYHFEPVLSTTFFFFVHFFQSASRSVSGSQLA